LRRISKIAGIGLGAVVAVTGAAALAVEIGGIPRYDVERVDLRVERTPARLARGKKLASILCVGCHADPVTGRLTGRPLVDVPAKFGAVTSRNITRHSDKGIGSWTDGEIAYLLRTGVARDGRYLPRNGGCTSVLACPADSGRHLQQEL